MADRRDALSDQRGVASKESIVDVAAELEALSDRIQKAKRGTASPGRAKAPEGAPLGTESARRAAEPVRAGAGRSRRNIILVLVLLLLAGGAALIFAGDDDPAGRVRNPAAITNTTAGVDRASPGATDPAAVSSARPRLLIRPSKT